MKNSGYALAFLAALLWGVSGTLAQFLFHERQMNPEWVVTIRLLLSGTVLLMVPLLRNPKSILLPWKDGNDRLELIGFSLFGMLTVQYTFFAAIKYSNAATATILQYLGPVFIACYYSIKEKRLPIKREALAIFFALVGTFLIVTHGSFETLSINPLALAWGIGSAIALAIYSIYPIRLLNKYDATVIIGWGMLIGGFAFSVLYHPWKISGLWDTTSFLFMSFIVVLGGAVSFCAYLVSVRIIGATTASLLACVEPLSAAIIAVFWLDVSFGLYDWVGMFCILFTIGLLTKK